MNEEKEGAIAKHQRLWAQKEKAWRLRKQADKRAARESGEVTEPGDKHQLGTWNESKK